jgi:MFS family permease
MAKRKKENKSRLLNYPKEVYVLWFCTFIIGFDFLGSVLIPFFRGWGGLSQLQTQTLQSIFTLAIFFLEVPTGLIGDVKGRKFSVVLGFLGSVIGPIVYTLKPNFGFFILAEVFFALAAAFTSGAFEALLFDTLKEKGLKDKFGKVQNINHNLMLFGMMLAALFTESLLQVFDVQQLFRLKSVAGAISALLVLLLVKEPKVKDDEEYIPNYKETFKNAYKVIKNNKSLQRIVAFVMTLSTLGYFVIWLHQVLLNQAGVSEDKFGWYKMLMLSAEIGIATLLIRLLKQSKGRRKLVSILMGILLVFGFLSGIFIDNAIGVTLFIVLGGGIGLKLRSIYSPYINNHIPSRERSTTLSAVSMLRRILLTILNPVIGFLTDIDIKVALATLVGIAILTFIFLLPKEKDYIAVNT